MLYSGLYEKCDYIVVRVAGRGEELALAKAHFGEFSKLRFTLSPGKPEDFEFPILEVAAYESQHRDQFAGFYIHTKGVTKIGLHSDHWREWLNEGTLVRWRENYEKICGGYDLSGPNYLPDYQNGAAPHFSGNFFWFNSSYFKDIDFINIDRSNRYWAEFAICNKQQRGHSVGWCPTGEEMQPFLKP